MRRRWQKMPPEVRREIIHLSAKGLSQRQILQHVDVSLSAVSARLRPLGGVIRKEMLHSSGPGLSLSERVDIALGLERHESLRAIARQLGRHPATISRELSRNGGRDGYRPVAAQERALHQARRPKPTKLHQNKQLCSRVISDLEHLFSPEQIAARLRADFGDDESMTLSHETIYKSLYVQGRGELRKELTRCLRSGRAVRRPNGRLETRGKIPNMVMISERPPEAEDRAVPGHWEGDLIIGKNGNSAIGTLVERSTRFVMLLHLSDKRAETVRDAMTRKIATLPAELFRSLTWDQGSEMSEHARFSIDTGVAVYFCDPHSPWQRGSNENTNGLLRQYFPKGTNLKVHTEAVLDAAAAVLTIGLEKP